MGRASNRTPLARFFPEMKLCTRVWNFWIYLNLLAQLVLVLERYKDHLARHVDKFDSTTTIAKRTRGGAINHVGVALEIDEPRLRARFDSLSTEDELDGPLRRNAFGQKPVVLGSADQRSESLMKNLHKTPGTHSFN